MSRMAAELTRFAEIDAPEPRPAFVAGLERHLAALMTDDNAIHVDVLPAFDGGPRNDVSRTRRTGRFAAAVAIALVVVAIGVTRGATRERSVRTANPASHTAESGAASGAAGDAAVETPSRGAPSANVDPLTGDVRGATSSAATTGPASGADTGTSSPAIGRGAAVSEGGTPFALRGTGTPARTLLDWDRYAGNDFGAYLVLRSAAPDDPEWPDASGRTLMLLRIENRDMTSHQDTGKVGTTPRYRIIVVDKEGKQVGRSGVFQSDVNLNARDLQDVRFSIS
jgi:hypothetical protein